MGAVLTHCYNSRCVGTVQRDSLNGEGAATGYSHGMEKWLLLAVLACAAASVGAQIAPLPAPSDIDMQLSRQQKRLELRAAVSSANRRSEQTPQLPEATAISHQMTSQERAELREQLRRYHPEPKHQP